MTSRAAHVIIMERSGSIALAVAHALEIDGFHTSLCVDEDAVAAISRRDPANLLVLDTEITDGDVTDFVRRIRASSWVGLLIVSASGDDDDVVRWLELGANDCVTKPFSARVLVARIHAALRHAGRSTWPNDEPDRPFSDPVYTFEGWQLVTQTRSLVSPADQKVDLTMAEYELLLQFVSKAGQLLGRTWLVQRAVHHQVASESRSLDTLVSRLRRKLQQKHSNTAFIRTVRGVGYVFSVPVRKIDN